MKSKIIFIGVLNILLLYGCLKDKGNYDYKEINKVKIYYSAYTAFAILGDAVEIEAILRFENKSDTTRFKYEWNVNGEIVSHGKVLKYVGKQIGSFYGQFTVIDTITGFRQIGRNVMIVVNSPYNKGWAILSKKNGQTEISQINLKTQGTDVVYYPFYNIYKTANEENIQGEPIALIEHYSGSKGPEILVMLEGGEGSMELDGKTMKRTIYTSQEFIDGYPEDFSIKDVSYLQYTNVILDRKGNIYTRYIKKPNNGFHQTAYNSTPVYIPKGMKITHLIHSNFNKTNHLMMFDEKNRRFLVMGSGTPSHSGEISELFYNAEYPQNYIPLDNTGENKLLYASAYNQIFGGCEYMVIFKTPENKYIYQTFAVEFGSSLKKLRIPSKDFYKDISEADITDKTIFWRLKTRNFLFFTGGIDNDILYYYDIDREKIKAIDHFEGREIVSIHPKSGNLEMGVCLKDGEFRVYDITLETLLSDTPVILYEESGFGEIVHLIWRYGNSGYILN